MLLFNFLQLSPDVGNDLVERGVIDVIADADGIGCLIISRLRLAAAAEG